MIKKVSQHTKLDEKLTPYSRNQQSLLFVDKVDYDTNQTVSKVPSSYEKYEEFPKKPEELNLNFPDIEKEHIKLNKIPEERKQKLQEEIDEFQKEEIERQKNIRNSPNYYSYYNYSPYNKERIEKYKNILKIDENLPDDLKDQIINKYKELQEIGKVFYQKYKEANELASTDINFNYDNLTYEQLFKNIAELIVKSISKKIGYFFGTKAYTYGFDLKLSLFNINALNFDEKINQITNLISQFNNIIEDYDKRKKLLPYLEKFIKKSMDEFLSDKENQEFLKFMDENAADQKRELVYEIINKIQNVENGYGRGGLGFDVSEIEKIKTYKKIYEEAGLTATFRVKRHIYEKLETNVRTEADNILDEKISNKLKLISLDLEKFKDIEQLGKKILAIPKYKKSKDLDQFRFEDDEKYLLQLDQEINSIIGSLDPIYKKFAGIDLKSYLITIKRMFQQEYPDRNFQENPANPENNTAIIFYYKYILLLLKNLFYNLGYRTTRIRLPYDLKLDDYNKITTQYLDNLAAQNVAIIFQKSFPSVDDYSRIEGFRYMDRPQNKINKISDIVSSVPKLNIENILKISQEKLSFIPKDLLLFLIKNLYKNYDLDKISIITNPSSFQITTFKIIVKLLEKFGKLNNNSFVNLYEENFDIIFYSVKKIQQDLDFSKNEDDTIDIYLSSIRSLDTLAKDTGSLQIFISDIHNKFGNVDKNIIVKIVKSKNFINRKSLDIVAKFLNAYLGIMNKGGAKKLIKDSGILLTELKRKKYIGQNFKENLLLIEKIGNEDRILSLSDPDFNKIKEAVATFETDLETLENADVIKEFLADYKPKNKQLFKLDLQIFDNLRFRVLRDKDPRALRVGVETGCCQRIGGYGEVAARDSFINPLAGVLILEYKNPEGQWKLLSQSYFHYVPEDNSYILDNVEENALNVRNSRVDLDKAYAYLAQNAKNKLKVKYFLSGKGYSKVDKEGNKFKTYKIDGQDPRYFDKRALTPSKRNFYTDFNEKSSIDLLSPKFDTTALKDEIIPQQTEQLKQSFIRQLRRIILGV